MIENFDWHTTCCPICLDPMNNHQPTSYCLDCNQRCLEIEVFCRLPSVRIYKEMRSEATMGKHMWRGGCTACFTTMQYWDSGATLGANLEHIRRCSRFRYAMSLDPSWQSGLSLRQRLSSSSGRQRDDGIQVGPPWVPSPLPFSTRTRAYGLNLEPVLPIVLPAGIAEIAAKMSAPFGRCQVCSQPKTLIFRRGMKGFTSICPTDENHAR